MCCAGEVLYVAVYAIVENGVVIGVGFLEFHRAVVADLIVGTDKTPTAECVGYTEIGSER